MSYYKECEVCEYVAEADTPTAVDAELFWHMEAEHPRYMAAEAEIEEARRIHE